MKKSGIVKKGRKLNSVFIEVELTEEEIENIIEDFKHEKYYNDANIEKLKEILK